MSKISKEGYEQIKVIKNALDSMYDKLNNTVYTKVKPTKNDDVNYKSANVPNAQSKKSTVKYLKVK